MFSAVRDRASRPRSYFESSSPLLEATVLEVDSAPLS